LTTSSEKYVYGVVTPATVLPRVKGIGGGRLSLVKGGAVAAVVSAVSPPVRAGKKEMQTHAKVLQSVLERGPVLPMRFGMVMPAEGVAQELLEPFEEDLVEQLNELAGTIEVHLRATYEEEALMSEVVKADSQIAALRSRLRGQSPDATYYAQIDLGQRVAQGVEAAAARDRDEILRALEPLSVAVSVGEPQHERVACDAAFLLDRAALDNFDRAVDELGRRGDGRLRFSYSGPHPPYSFVELPVQV
jgi:hypothetical protein